ncbi:hypothetical protein ACA910_016664 [Epithemia clementina (nom. ined.)]
MHDVGCCKLPARRGTLVCFRSVLFATLSVNVTDGLGFQVFPRPFAHLKSPQFSKPHGVTRTALFDSDGHRDVDSAIPSNVTVNGSGVKILNEHQLFNGLGSQSLTLSSTMIADVPLPTENGGYSHTRASKAKISAANKGRTPWNKGRQRSEEEKARIAAGVRATNRERFLQKLKDLGVTEQEYEEQKKAERRKKDAERRARRTENGGYRPTEETRQKISRILKEKHAKGEIRRKKVDPKKVRRGFAHTEETRQKISESLKQRWATDVDYRESMQNKTLETNARQEVRERISKTLKAKWKDPEFRERMIENMANRTRKQTLDRSHREKISEAMKLRWQDSKYRKKVTDSLAKRTEEQTSRVWPLTENKRANSNPANKRAASLRKNESPSSADAHAHRVFSPTSDREAQSTDLRVIKPLSAPKKKTTTKQPKRTTTKPKTEVKALEFVPLRPKQQQQKTQSSTPKTKTSTTISPNNNPTTSSEKGQVGATKNDHHHKNHEWDALSSSSKDDENGSVSRLREERRDLYDFLYGDGTVKVNSKLASVFDLEDENLDTFDPYGLDDF